MTESEEQKVKIMRKLRTCEIVSDILDKVCIGIAIGCMILNMLGQNWICALIWFNVLLWNWRAIRETSRAKDLELKNAILGYLVYEKYAKDNEKQEAKETIDIEPSETEAKEE